jgi:hypothetical protein
METIKGGREVAIMHEDGAPETVLVRQLPVSEYGSAFGKVDDEMALAALVCKRDAAWIASLTPESYEAVQTAMQEVNTGGFFAYSGRRNKMIIDRLNNVKPEVLRLAAESVSKTSSSASRMSPV